MARRGGRRDGSRGGILIGAVAITALITAAGTMALSGGRGGAGMLDQALGIAGDVAGAPFRWAGGVIDNVGAFFGGASENARLREENAALLQWRDQARAMAERLDAYEKLNAIRGEALPEGKAGRMVAESAGPFSRAGIVNLGKNDGVAVNWIVINQNGLIGRVISVSDTTSRVLLLGDADSRVPVMGEQTRARAILVGDKTDAPRLAHLSTPPLMTPDERIMTSGDDGIFPRGIAVGEGAPAPDGQWRARLAMNRSAVDFVRLVPPSNFPPPLEPASPPPLAPPPVAGAAPTGDAPAASGAVLPLAPGAAAVPAAATPEAVRAAQETARASAAAKEAARKLEAERDAARETARRAEAARLAAERRAAASAKTDPPAAATPSQPRNAAASGEAVRVAPSAVDDARAKETAPKAEPKSEPRTEPAPAADPAAPRP